jgi:nitrogen fixation protein FixH
MKKKMKINWGTAVVIAFGLFITFILYFVFKVQTNSKYDNELSDDEYYKKELTFEAEMQKEQNAINLTEKVVILNDNQSVKIIFPSNFDFSKVKGTLFFYRPSNKKLDFQLPINLTSNTMNVKKEKLVTGTWNISIDWSYENTNYLNKKNIYF